MIEVQGKQKKKKRRRVHLYPRNLLALSGFLQVALLTVHIAAITKMTTVIVGFYLLAFILSSTINILNGYGFSAGAGAAAIVGTLLVSCVEFFFGVLYMKAVLTETALLTAEITIPEMYYSLALFAGGMLAAVLALVFEVIVSRKSDDLYRYIM
ncbi:hypothetical protein B4O97_06470 [Marispirochaeta aestuarii]|uniref:Uncharacterized protein n=1 Tax=Marispirochaeta aestuarii TaxID=1963862 RepID=A0A1Y1RZG7_9SPIO|nr:hypothetical protein [Marispirochaeta aestuarii]ORC36232.1 hypothetical protein B4O97_06470 [Marispirochaeta aestuarii]